jgi:gamma-glutamyltranspeptidase
MGGLAQPQILAQVLVRLIDHRVTPESVVAAPRWIVAHEQMGEPPGSLLAEPDAAAALERNSASSGPRLVVLDDIAEDTGHAQVVAAAEGGLAAGSDPRADGAAAAG